MRVHDKKGESMNELQLARLEWTGFKYSSASGQKDYALTQESAFFRNQWIDDGQITIPSISDIISKEKLQDYDLSIFNDYLNKSSISLYDMSNNKIDIEENMTAAVRKQTYKLVYTLESGNIVVAPTTLFYSVKLEYTFNAIKTHLPLKKWTILDVIIRCSDLIETLRRGEKPRFRLEGTIYSDITGRCIGYYGDGGEIVLREELNTEDMLSLIDKI